MRQIDFLDAVGRVDKRAVEECLTLTKEDLRRDRMKRAARRISSLAASVLVIAGGIFFIKKASDITPADPVVSKSEPLSGDSVPSGSDREPEREPEAEAEPEQGVLDLDGFHIVDGILTRYDGSETDLTVPEEVISIAARVFYANKIAPEIETVRLGEQVRQVDAEAFAGLNGSWKLLVDTDNPAFRDEDGVILSADGETLYRYERSGEDSYTLPESVRTIAAHAFQNSALTEMDFGERVEVIGFNAFAGCFQLQSVDLPDSVRVIGDGAFSMCVSAVDGSVPEDAQIGDWAFYSVPFALSDEAGVMCPLEEINRGLITPSEAVRLSDRNTLMKEIDYVLALLSKRFYFEPDEQALLASGVTDTLPFVPEDAELPASASFEQLIFTDNGWGRTGLYDLTILMKTGPYTLAMEATAYGTDTALRWSDVPFRIARAYFLPSSESAAEERSEILSRSESGWTAFLDRNQDLYSGITWMHRDGRLIRSFLPAVSSIPYRITFSPDGTRAAVEYESRGLPSFYIQSLNGDKLLHGLYDCNEYLNRYFGQYKAGSLSWIDEDNVEGENEFGRFRFNVYASSVTQTDEDPRLTDPDNRAVVPLTFATAAGEVTLRIPETWRLHGTYYTDLSREASGLESYRMLLPSGIDRSSLLDGNGNWTTDYLGIGWIFPQTVVTEGVNPNGVGYLILESPMESVVPQTEIIAAFSWEGRVILDFKAVTYEEDVRDGERGLYSVILPIIDSVRIDPSSALPEEDGIYPFASLESDASLAAYARALAGFFPHPAADPAVDLAKDPELCPFLLFAGGQIALEAADIAVRINSTAVMWVSHTLLGMGGTLPDSLFTDPAWGWDSGTETFPLAWYAPPVSAAVRSVERTEDGGARVIVEFPEGGSDTPVLVYRFAPSDNQPPRPRLLSVEIP